MFEQSYWRRAIIVSSCIHCLLFVGVGWLGGGIFSKAAEPETIEMELISSVAQPEQVSPVPIAMPQAVSPVPKPTVSDSTRPITDTPKSVANTVASNAVSENVSPQAESVVSASSGDTAPSASAAPVVAEPAAPKRISAPRILSKVEPDYPADARQEGIVGKVGIKVEVLENGRPGEVQLARSSGRRSLDEAALEAVRQWRFVPAQEAGSGEAIRCFTTFSVVFELS